MLQCGALKKIENEAPNLWIVRIDSQPEKVPVGDVLQVKDLQMQDCYESNLVHYARAKLPSIMPNLETLNLSSAGEVYSQTLVFPLLFLQGWLAVDLIVRDRCCFIYITAVVPLNMFNLFKGRK